MRPLILIAALLLSACGFHPVYGVNKYTAIGVEEKLAQIEIGNVPNRSGQYLRNVLIDRFYREGRPAAPYYALTFGALSEQSVNLDITETSDATRGELRVGIPVLLTDKTTGAVLLERTLQSRVGYNILAGEFATRVSRENARKNALEDLARQIEQQLSLFFKRQS